MEQNQTNSNNETVTAVDLIKLFLKKIKAIIIIALVGAILGGALGGVMAIRSTTYNAEMHFYTSYSDGSSKLLYALQTGSFAEKLLLGDNGLPEKKDCDPEDYENALKAIEEFSAVREERKELQKELSTYHIEEIEYQHSKLKSEYDSVLKVLELYKSSAAEEALEPDPEHKKMVEEYQAKLVDAEKALKDYEDEVYEEAVRKKREINTSLSVLWHELNYKRDAAEEAVEKVLKPWREQPEVRKQISEMSGFVSYEKFLPTVDEKAQADAKEDDDIKHGYYKITVSVPNDGELAEKIVNSLKEHLCEYVSEYAEDLTGAVNVQCKFTKLSVSINKTPGSPIPDAVKYAAIAGVSAAVLAYLFFMVQMLMKVSEKASEKGSVTEDKKQEGEEIDGEKE